MADLEKEGDALKRQYLEQALNANADAAGAAKLSDLFNKDSTTYAKPEETEEEKQRKEEEKKAAMPPPKPTTDSEGYPIVDPIHTYKEDLADIVNKDKLSLERIAMMQSGAANTLSPESAEKKKSKKFLVAGGALLLLSMIIIGVVTSLSRNRPAPIQTPTKERYIIFSEASQKIELANTTKTEIAASLKKAGSNFREQESVMELVPVDAGARAALSALLAKVGARMPSDMGRTLYERFFLGLYSKNGVASPFMLFYTNSYDIAYPGMLRWEGFMQDDLNWLFDTRPQSGTSTPALTFKDRVVSNLDVRSFEDASGRSAFFYTFLDQNTILLARTGETVRMVQDRVRQAKFQ